MNNYKNKSKPQENKGKNVFPSSKDDMHTLLEQKKTQNCYLQLLKDGKFSEAQDLWNSIVRDTFIVKELQIIY